LKIKRLKIEKLKEQDRMLEMLFFGNLSGGKQWEGGFGNHPGLRPPLLEERRRGMADAREFDRKVLS